MLILLHSSKTMHIPEETLTPLGRPHLLGSAQGLVDLFRGSSVKTIETLMHVSAKKAEETKALFETWSTKAGAQIPAIDAFTGDIYSGLQVQTWSPQDRQYAHDHLFILSGLYGGLRACDGVMPYRLEMGYKLPGGQSMYQFWGDAIARLILEKHKTLLNLSAVEYTKAVLPYLDAEVITPKFLTISPKTGKAVFVAVHAKIARGACARWIIQNQIDDPGRVKEFNGLGYSYDQSSSTREQPVFVCEKFGGLGLSVRSSK